MREVGAADDGRFEITALYPTTYSVEVRTHGNEERARPPDVAAGTKGLTIVVGE